MTNLNTTKHVDRDGFATLGEARADAKRFVKMGGKVVEGGERENGFGWSGDIHVHDTQLNVDGKFGCGRCAGTGAFVTYVLNGKPKGPGGDCFRCDGKGYHTRADRKRNWGYDRYGVKVSL